MMVDFSKKPLETAWKWAVERGDIDSSLVSKKEERTTFRDLLIGNGMKLYILEFFMTNRELEFTKKDIADTDEKLKALHQCINDGFIKKTRKSGRENLYMLNEDNFVVKRLTEIYDYSLKKELERMGKSR